MTVGVITPENARGIGDFFNGGAGGGGVVHVSSIGVILVILAVVALIADVLWLMLASVFGLARLLSSEPIGRVK
jgi:hypothetical protein